MKFAGKTIAAAALAGVVTAFSAQAAEPDDAIKYRHYLMEVVGGHTNNFFAILQGKVEHKDALLYHAKGIADASEHVIAAFKQNTAGQGSAETESKDEIWEDWDKFEAAANKMTEASKAMVAVLEAGDTDGIGAAAQALGGSCKGCHDDFREE